MRFGSSKRFGGRFSYSNADNSSDSEPIMILKEESTSASSPITEAIAAPTDDTPKKGKEEPKEEAPVKKTEHLKGPTAQKEKELSQPNKSVSTTPSTTKASKVEPVTQKNISVNHSAAKPKVTKESASDNNAKNKQSQGQNQGSTTPKTTTSAKKTKHKANHQHDKKTNSNAVTPKAREKIAKARDKAIKKVQSRLAQVRHKVPKV